MAELRRAVADVKAFCTVHSVSLSGIAELEANGFARLQAISDARDALISQDNIRRDFLAHERLINALYRAIKPDPAAFEFFGDLVCVRSIADAIRQKINPRAADISEVMGDINELLDRSVTGMMIREAGPPAIDLSKINFEALAKRFEGSNTRRPISRF